MWPMCSAATVIAYNKNNICHLRLYFTEKAETNSSVKNSINDSKLEQIVDSSLTSLHLTQFITPCKRRNISKAPKTAYSEKC